MDLSRQSFKECPLLSVNHLRSALRGCRDIASTCTNTSLASALDSRTTDSGPAAASLQTLIRYFRSRITQLGLGDPGKARFL